MHSLPDEDGCTWGAFSPDGTQLLTRGKQGSAKLRDLETGTTLHEFQHETAAELTCCTFDLSGQLVVTGTKEGTVTVWDATDGSSMSHVCPNSQIIAAQAIDSTSLVCITKDPAEYDSNNVRLWRWNWRNGTCYSSDLISWYHHVDLITLNQQIYLVDCSLKNQFKLVPLTPFLELLTFLHERINTEQAFTLCRVYEHIFMAALIALKQRTGTPVVTKELHSITSKDVQFTFEKYPHLEKYFLSLPPGLQKMFPITT